MDNKKILKALKYIQDICNSHICRDCPLGDDNGNCIVQCYDPSEWRLTDKKWNAFKLNEMEY